MPPQWFTLMKFVPRSLPETGDLSRGLRRPGDRLKTIAGFVLILVIIYILLGFAALGISHFIPDRWERKLAGDYYIPKNEEAATDLLDYPQEILDKLMADESLRDLDYTLFILENPEPNAVAVPGGGIGLTPPLIELLEKEKGMAFILAHEMGHHENRHIIEGLSRGLLFSIAATFLFNYDGLSPANLALEAAEKGYSRRKEREADEFALRLVQNKYGDISGALEFFDKMQNEGNKSAWRKYFSTHPLTEDRIDYLKKLGKKLIKNSKTVPVHD